MQSGCLSLLVLAETPVVDCIVSSVGVAVVVEKTVLVAAFVGDSL